MAGCLGFEYCNYSSSIVISSASRLVPSRFLILDVLDVTFGDSR